MRGEGGGGEGREVGGEREMRGGEEVEEMKKLEVVVGR